MGRSMRRDEQSGWRVGEKVPSGFSFAGACKNFPWCTILDWDCQVDADEQEDIAESFEIEAVPTFIILRVRRHILF